MQEATQAIQPRPSLDDFAAMLDETLGATARLEGSVVRGTVVGLDDDIVIVDVGLKSEAVIDINQFKNERGEVEGVKYSQLTIVLINAVKEQQAQIEALRKQVADLQKRLPQKRPRTTRARKTNGN